MWLGVLGMKKFNYETEILIKNIFGGTIRWLLIYIYNAFLKREKPNRKDFVNGHKKEEDFFGYTNTQHRNTISTIISSFILFALIVKLFRMLF